MIIEKYIRTYIVVNEINHKKCSNDCRFYDYDADDTDNYCFQKYGWCILFIETDDYTSELIINMYRCQQCLSEFGMEGTNES